MAMGRAAANAREFELEAKHGNVVNGICSNPFLEENFKTVEYRIKVNINDDGTWSYTQDTVLMMPGRKDPFHHSDQHTLRKVAESNANPMAQPLVKVYNNG